MSADLFLGNAFVARPSPIGKLIKHFFTRTCIICGKTSADMRTLQEVGDWSYCSIPDDCKGPRRSVPLRVRSALREVRYVVEAW